MFSSERYANLRFLSKKNYHRCSNDGISKNKKQKTNHQKPINKYQLHRPMLFSALSQRIISLNGLAVNNIGIAVVEFNIN